MAGRKSKIEAILTLDAKDFRRKLYLAERQLAATGRNIANKWRPVTGIFTSVARSVTLAATAAGTAATAGGFYALQSVLRSSVTDAMALDRAMYNMGASLEAANRQFDVGTAADWEQALRSMRSELKVFSETDLRNASARTIDMTKRLGLSREQMLKVMRAAANLGAGKFKLVDSVKRVTAALRGEAEASEALGLTLNENYVKAWHEANNATGKAWKDLTDLEKAQVRYNVLLEQATPSAGRAAESYNTMSGTMAGLAASYNELKTSIGQVVTENTFFVQAGHVINDLLAGWKKEIEDNKAAWMIWSKQAAIAVLEFVADSADGMNSVYKAFKKLAGVLHLAWGGTVILAKGFQYLFEQSNRFFGNTDKAEYWAKAQQDSAAIIDSAMRAAADAFEDSDRGLEMARKAADSVRVLKAQLERIEARPITETGRETDKLERKMVKVGDTWTTVWVEAGKDSDDFFDDATRSLAAFRADAARGVDIPMRTVQQRAAGGLIQRFATGGRLPGYGGGDRIPALLEAGEYVIRKEAVARFGSGIFNALNNLRLPRFAAGGAVGGGGPSSAPVLGHYTVDLVLPGQATPVRGRFSPAEARRLVDGLAAVQRSAA